MTGIPEKEWDWVAFLDAVTGIAAIARILDQVPMNDATRMVCLERLAVDSKDSLRLADLLVARAKRGDQWW
ncbi:hypothetical protein [Streptomyces cyaneofuscatus]|uniref:hypothetical protein n=1 Tax=Streptomyces cyaneofuscatus TaxID=66883 RepID=UPI00364C88C5